MLVSKKKPTKNHGKNRKQKHKKIIVIIVLKNIKSSYIAKNKTTRRLPVSWRHDYYCYKFKSFFGEIRKLGIKLYFDYDCCCR